MKGLNKVSLIGNLGSDPDYKELKGKIPVAKFDMATTAFYKNQQGELVSKTEWHKIISWRGLAELTRNFLKGGSTVFIEGSLRTRSYEGRDGVKHYITEIIADSIIMLDKSKQKKNKMTA